MMFELVTVLMPSVCNAAAATTCSMASRHAVFCERCSFKPLDPTKFLSSQYGHCIGGMLLQLGTVSVEEVGVENHEGLFASTSARCCLVAIIHN